MRERGEGESSLTNAHISTRRRLRKLYEDYKPRFCYWKLVLITRKLALAAVAIVLNKNARLQVCVGQRGCCVCSRTADGSVSRSVLTLEHLPHHPHGGVELCGIVLLTRSSRRRRCQLPS